MTPKRWLLTLLCFGVIGCFFYNVCLPKMCIPKTETAECTLVTDVIKTNGFLVLDETIIDFNKKTGVVYRLNDGEKVAKGGIIADIYENPKEADIDKKITDIDEEIAAIRYMSQTETYDLRKPDILDSEINKTITEMQTLLTKSEYMQAFQKRNSLCKLMSEKRMANGKSDNFADKIYDLENKKKSLETSISGKKQKFLSPLAGYFVSFLDGYENSISYDEVKKAKLKNFNPENIKTTPTDECLGKIVTSGDWYMICEISEDEKQKLKKGMECQIRVPCADNRDMICTVHDLISQDSGKNFAVIRCNYISKEIFSFREGEIYLKIGEYYGYKIKKSAVRYKDQENNLIGVNVRYGNSVLFRRINVIYSESDFVVASESAHDEGADTQYIRRGDEIII